MRLSLGLFFLFFIVNVSAGGIRGAYERMFVWYAYQANIDMLEKDLKGKDKLNLDGLEICKGQSGSGRHGTMSFQEFIGFTNRDAKGKTPSPARWKSLPNGNPPRFDQTAQLLLDKGATSNWEKMTEILPSANSYTKLLPEISKVVYKFSQSLPADNGNISRARASVGQVEKTRQVDYDRYRIPAMKASPEFKDYVIKPYQIVLGTVKGSSTELLDLSVLAQDNELKLSNVKRTVGDWERKTFFNDPINGPIAKRHEGALKASSRAVRIATTGSC
ncbi:hypothetical protein IL306_000999 [Fusarium sp. DS 682]|nr:hypothetical protein IL306_000999 [Fusarium sp. DS 682]